ncbi:vacuolar amino acid transporter 1 [Prunus yedoensis var. nudiflora]|uniref:Vacuolar amino acid transporter 1 n=1 Tax=Prunus yedoensis var. nudiflora TaxID=2094558 RepID=A0A314ZQ52_PRUYE|nr:vacuolar amino acid transporter 1 [Prunus yedoensis var. nudiflora]
MESQNQHPPQPQEPSKLGTTFSRTCFNGLNTLSGVGILSIPFALSEGGWLSLILLFLLALLCWYTGLLLQRCMDANLHIKTYPDIGDVAFGLKGRITISIFMYLELYLVAVEFLILEGDNLNQLFPNMGFNMAGIKVGGRQCFVLLTAVVILPTTWLKNLGLLAYVSAGGVLASAVLVACVFWVGAVDGVGFPTLCNSMKDRSQFSKVLLVCFITSTITYGSMAVLGYLMFGQYLNSQVTLNLPIRKISSRIAIYITIINPLTKYAIVITPIAAAIEEARPFRNSRVISILVRTLIVISTVLVALMVPFFSYVMAFVGAFLSVTVSVLLPCLFYLKINVAARRFGLELVTIIGIMVIGSLVGVVGTYTSLKEIVNRILN